MTYVYGPHELAAQNCDEMSEDDLAEFFGRKYTPVELMLLAGYGRPATAAPRQIDVRRGLDTLPALDNYRPAGSEALR